MTEVTSLAEIEAIARSALAKMPQTQADRASIEHIQKHLQINWNHRYTNKLGSAKPSIMLVELSSQIWPLCSPERRAETVVHEVAHLAAVPLHESMPWGRYERNTAHGKTWREMMVRTGYPNASVTHDVDRTSLVAHTLVEGICICRSFRLRPRSARMAAQGRLKCMNCRAQIYLAV